MKNIINIKDFTDISRIESDLLICPDIIKPSGNMYDIIFESDSLESLLSKFIEWIKGAYGVRFDGYVKSLQAYIQSEDCPDLISIPKVLKREIKPIAEYSFILFTKADNTTLYFKNNHIDIKDGEMIIFKTDEYIKDETNSNTRIALIGSVTDKIEQSSMHKSNI